MGVGVLIKRGSDRVRFISFFIWGDLPKRDEVNISWWG